MDIYFQCIYCHKTLATDESNTGRKINCIDCGKLLTIPLSTVKAQCNHCGNTFRSVHSLVNHEVQCLACQKNTPIHDTNTQILSAPPNLEELLLTKKTTPKKLPLHTRLHNYIAGTDFRNAIFGHTQLLLAFVAIIASLGYIDLYARQLAMTYLAITLVPFAIAQALIIRTIFRLDKYETVRDCDGQTYDKCIIWLAHYKSMSGFIWNWIACPVVGLFALMTLNIPLIFILVVYQLERLLVVVELKNTNDKLCKHIASVNKQIITKQILGDNQIEQAS